MTAGRAAIELKLGLAWFDVAVPAISLRRRVARVAQGFERGMAMQVGSSLLALAGVFAMVVASQAVSAQGSPAIRPVGSTKRDCVHPEHAAPCRSWLDNVGGTRTRA